MSGHNLTLGATSQKPAYSPDPEHGLGPFGSAGFLILKGCVNGNLPYNTGGNLLALSVFWFFRLDSLPSAKAWIFRFPGGGLGQGSFTAMVTTTGAIEITRMTAGGNVVMTTTTTLALGVGYTLCMTCGALSGQALRLYINGALDTSATLLGDVQTFTSQPSYYWGTDSMGFTASTSPNAIIGRTLLYDGELSAAQVAGMHAQYRVRYTNLPSA